jgi:hypothetical protein
MHDAAVGSANFTECVPAPGGGMARRRPRGEVGNEPILTVQRRPQVVGGRASVGRNLRALTRIARIGCRTSMGYDSFQ